MSWSWHRDSLYCPRTVAEAQQLRRRGIDAFPLHMQLISYVTDEPYTRIRTSLNSGAISGQGIERGHIVLECRHTGMRRELWMYVRGDSPVLSTDTSERVYTSSGLS